MSAAADNFRLKDKPPPGNPSGGKANVIVTHNGTRLTGTLALADDRRSVRFTSDVAFESSGVYTVLVKGGADAPADDSGLHVIDNAVSAFTAADTLPPSVLSVSPAAEEHGI